MRTAPRRRRVLHSAPDRASVGPPSPNLRLFARVWYKRSDPPPEWLRPQQTRPWGSSSLTSRRRQPGPGRGPSGRRREPARPPPANPRGSPPPRHPGGCEHRPPPARRLRLLPGGVAERRPERGPGRTARRRIIDSVMAVTLPLDGDLRSRFRPWPRAILDGPPGTHISPAWTVNWRRRCRPGSAAPPAGGRAGGPAGGRT